MLGHEHQCLAVEPSELHDRTDEAPGSEIEGHNVIFPHAIQAPAPLALVTRMRVMTTLRAGPGRIPTSAGFVVRPSAGVRASAQRRWRGGS
jgi:hypothetical protein